MLDELAKNRISVGQVIPAKAGTQLFQDVLDPGFRRVTILETSFEIIMFNF